MRFDLDDIPMLTKACTFEQVREVYSLASKLYLHPSAAIGIACGLTQRDATFFAFLEDGLKASELMRSLQFSLKPVQTAMVKKICKTIDLVTEASSRPTTSEQYMTRLVEILYEYLSDSGLYPEEYLARFRKDDAARMLRGTEPGRLMDRMDTT